MATLIKRRRIDGTLAYRVQDRTTGFPTASHTFSRLKDARAYRLKVESERQAKTAGVHRGRHTLAQAVSTYTQTGDFKRQKSNTTTAVRMQWWVDAMGKLPLSEITAELIADHLYLLEVRGVTGKGVSGATLNRYRSALSRVFRYAIKKRHWLSVNPCSMLEAEEETQRQRVITADEWAALLSAAGELAGSDPATTRGQLPGFLRFLYATGARRGESMRLRWEYVDLKARELTFHDTKNKKHRTIPLFDDALAVIKQQKTIRRDGVAWVFPSLKRDTAPANFDEPFRLAREYADLDKPDANGELLILHTLRRSMATEAGKAGATEMELMAAGGWDTPAMVARYCKRGKENAGNAFRKRARA